MKLGFEAPGDLQLAVPDPKRLRVVMPGLSVGTFLEEQLKERFDQLERRKLAEDKKTMLFCVANLLQDFFKRMIGLEKAGKGKGKAKNEMPDDAESRLNPAKLLREADSITAADLEKVSLDKSLLQILKALPKLIANRNEAAQATPYVLARLLMDPNFHEREYFQWAPVIKLTGEAPAAAAAVVASGAVIVANRSIDHGRGPKPNRELSEDADT
ncbi:MAG: hypothetical protein M1826_003084 [Phylliscum demangeonii]|nr:MAG: hypothetical protein M1826_003084 [Phylliscum demangeonii]